MRSRKLTRRLIDISASLDNKLLLFQCELQTAEHQDP